jgi:hypothetical protein
MDKRMDEWVPEEDCRMKEPTPQPPPKKKRGRPPKPAPPPPQPATPSVEENGASMEVLMTEQDFDLQHHKQLTAQRNFDIVIFEKWKLRPWCVGSIFVPVTPHFLIFVSFFFYKRYFSPYPLTETEADEFTDAPAQPATKIPGVARATVRSHGRTSDLLAGGLLRPHTGESMLWVCHFCFKYMADGTPWELHTVRNSYLSCCGPTHTQAIRLTERLQSEASTRKESIPKWRSYYLGSRWGQGEGTRFLCSHSHLRTFMFILMPALLPKSIAIRETLH